MEKEGQSPVIGMDYWFFVDVMINNLPYFVKTKCKKYCYRKIELI
jgi:hypothetical protein